MLVEKLLKTLNKTGAKTHIIIECANNIHDFQVETDEDGTIVLKTNKCISYQNKYKRES